MKNLLTLFLFSFLLLQTLIIKADHAGGGYLTYHCLGNNSYIVTLTFYRDCNGINFPNNFDLNVSSASCGIDFNEVLVLSTSSVVSYCDNLTTTCENGNVPGYEKVIYLSSVILPQQCTDWIFSVDINARNVVDYVVGGELHLESMVNNTIGCNPSVGLIDDPVIFGCLGFPSSYIPTFFNPNGYNIDVELICPTGTNNIPVVYSSGLSCTNPYPNTNGFNFNSSTGAIQFTPSVIGTSYFAYKINMFDLNGNYIGYIVRDMQIVVLPYCLNLGPIFETFGPPILGMPNNYTIESNQGEQRCIDVHIYPTIENNDQLTNISVDISQVPNGGSSIINYGNYAVVTICYLDDSHDCFEEIYPFTIFATDNGCPNEMSASQTYNLKFVEGVYCQENIYYSNYNSQSGNFLPSFSRASNEIWVGNNMPPSYPGVIGDVEIHYPVTFEAGFDITLPSCTGGGSGCIDLIGTSAGDIHFYIKPNNCNSECEGTPLEVTVEEVFDCHNEHLNATANYGVPPYTYNWFQVNSQGQTIGGNGGYLGYGSSIVIHDKVENLTCGSPFTPDGIFYYKLVVSDATGLYEEYYGDVLGTRAFYVPIEGNLDANNPTFLITNVVSSEDYVFAFDHLNDISHGSACGPPYYGATKYTFAVWPRWAINDFIIYSERDIENTSDWSLENGEIYWNGYYDNDINANCVNTVGMYDCYLKLENCLTSFYEELDEIFVSGVCYDDLILIDPAGMILNTNFSQSNNPINQRGESQTISNVENNTNFSDITIYPNPSFDGIFNILNNSQIVCLRIFDSQGKLILNQNNSIFTEVDLSQYDPGLYFLEIKLENTQKIFKLIRE